MMDESPDKKIMDKNRLLLKKSKRKMNRLVMVGTEPKPQPQFSVNWREPEIISQSLSQYIRANGISRHGKGRQSMATMRNNSIEGPEKTTNYKNIKDFQGVDAILQESDNGLRLVQKYVSITSNTTNFKTDRATIVAKNETPKMNVNLAVSPASGFNVPEQY